MSDRPLVHSIKGRVLVPTTHRSVILKVTNLNHALREGDNVPTDAVLTSGKATDINRLCRGTRECDDEHNETDRKRQHGSGN